MAELNPPVQPQGDANFQSYSRGSIPDTSIGGLFQDLGQTVQSGVRAATDIITGNIQEDVYRAADEIRDTTINRLGGPPANATPEEITAYQRQVQALHQSRRAGVLSDSHYWAQLDVETRRIRQKYPGHRDVVDQVVKQVTGQDPANALVNALQSELLGRRSNEQAQYEYWLKQATELGAPSAMHYATLVQQGRPPSLLQLQNETAQIQQQRTMTAMSKAQLELRVAQGQQVTREASQGATQELMTRAGNFFVAGTGAIPRFNELLAEYRRNPPNPSKLAELQNFFNAQVRGPMMQILEETLNVPVAGGQAWSVLIRDQNEIQNIRKTYTDMVDQLGTAVSNGNWSEFTALKNQLEAYQRADTIAALQGQHGSLFRGIQTAREIYGPQAFQNPEFLNAVPQLQQGLRHLFQSGHVGGVISRTPLAETTMRDFQVVPNATDRANLIGARISSTVADLAKPELSEQGVEALGSTLFGAGNIRFLETYVRNRAQVYNQIVGDARVHQNMQRIRSSHPQLYQNYENWVVKGFADSIRGTASEIREAIEDPNVRANIVFDQRNGSFLYNGDNTATRNHINEINTAIAGFRTFQESRGVTGDALTLSIAQRLRSTNIDPNAGARTGTWRGIFDSVRNFLNSRLGETGQDDVGPLSSRGGRPQDYEPLLGEIRRGEAGLYGYTSSFGPNRESTQVAGLTNMTINEVLEHQRNTIAAQRQRGFEETERSSAVGGYQFLHRELQDALNLAGIPRTEWDTVRFTPEIQDRLAVAVLQSPRVNIQEYIRNPTQANEDRVINALAGYWAALPMTSGRGRYDGDAAGNRANRSLDSIRRLVRGIAQQWSYNPVE